MMKYKAKLQKITNEQLQPFYEMTTELVSMTDRQGYWADELIHIYHNAVKLASAFKIHMEKVSEVSLYLGRDSNYKYLLPLLSLSEKEELRRLALESGNEALIEKCGSMDIVYDFASDRATAGARPKKVVDISGYRQTF